MVFFTSSNHFHKWLSLLLIVQSVHTQETDEYYNRDHYNSGYQEDEQQHSSINAKTFFQTCLSIRDANLFLSDDEQFHHPLLPAALPTGSRHDNDDNGVNNISHVPKFLSESRMCTDYKCMAHDLQRDPRQLDRLVCNRVRLFNSFTRIIVS